MGSEIGSIVSGAFEFLILIIVVLFFMLLFFAGNGTDKDRKHEPTAKKSETQDDEKGNDP